MTLTKSKLLKVLIAAAGKGTRTGLPYPKTLFQINDKPILIHLLKTLSRYDDLPCVIVSPSGHNLISASLIKYQKNAELLLQNKPQGMGDAVLKLKHSKQYSEIEDVILVWGDIPFLQQSTIDKLLIHHKRDNNVLSFATAMVDKAYTQVLRDNNGRVLNILETREKNETHLITGERDIGLFIFKKNIVLPFLEQDAPEKYSRSTLEHGFLYIIGLLVSKNYKVGGYDCANHLDLVSFNQFDDIKDWV